MTDLRGLTSLGNDDRSQFADPGIAERLRAGNPLRIALDAATTSPAPMCFSRRGPMPAASPARS